MPICVTFYFLGDRPVAVVDPTAEEESVSTARVSISLNIYGDICGIRSHGGALGLAPHQLT